MARKKPVKGEFDPKKVEAMTLVLLKQGITENDFSLDRDTWELAVFLNATEFSSFLFKGRGESERHDFPSPGEAMAKAESMDTHGRRALVYAITKSGRRVCLDRIEWPKFRLMWEVKRNAKMEQD